MTKHQPTPSDTAHVAIDIAKHRNEVLIEVPGRGRRRRLTVLNTRADHHDRLLETLGDLGYPVIVGFEATGNYHRPLAWRLVEAGFGVRLISSVVLARTREALHNGWDKNDPKDAQVILHMLRIGLTQHYHDPLAEGPNDIQELSKTHEVVSKAKTEILHRIQIHYLPLYFPEIDRFRNSSRSEWFFAFLDRFPTPASITVLDKDAFVKAAWDVVGRKVSKALRAPPAVPQVLRPRSRNPSVRTVPGPDQALQVRQRTPQARLVDGRTNRRPPTREQLQG